MRVGARSQPSMVAAMSSPTMALRSSSGLSGSVSRMPTTVNQWPPSHTCVVGLTEVMPSRCAVTAPSTTAG